MCGLTGTELLRLRLLCMEEALLEAAPLLQRLSGPVGDMPVRLLFLANRGHSGLLEGDATSVSLAFSGTSGELIE